MSDKKDILLHCPQCGKARFSTISTGEIESNQLNFKKAPPLKNQEIVYICVNCGFVISNEDSMRERYLLIITGNSESYKSNAIVATGYKKIVDDSGGKFKEFIIIKDHNTIIATKEAMEKGLPANINQLLDSAVVKQVDCSDNNYAGVIKAVKAHKKYYENMQI